MQMEIWIQLYKKFSYNEAIFFLLQKWIELINCGGYRQVTVDFFLTFKGGKSTSEGRHSSTNFLKLKESCHQTGKNTLFLRQIINADANSILMAQKFHTFRPLSIKCKNGWSSIGVTGKSLLNFIYPLMQYLPYEYHFISRSLKKIRLTRFYMIVSFVIFPYTPVNN